MSDAILVVNAGSSSIKFSVFLERGDALDLLLGGQIESLYTTPRFKAKDAAGAVVGERQWAAGAKRWATTAPSPIWPVFCANGSVSTGSPPSAIGWCMAGPRLRRAGAADRRDPSRYLERFIPLAPLHQPH